MLASALLLSLMLAPAGENVAPPPRPKAGAAAPADDCLCTDGDVRCRARAALALHAAATKNKAVPQAMPSAERIAARAALEKADKSIKASAAKAPTETPR